MCRKVKNRRKYAKALALIRELEAKYGSVMRVPYGNRKMAVVHNMLGKPHRNGPRPNTKIEKLDKIRHMLWYGFRSKEIRKKIGCSDDTLTKVRRMDGIPIIPYFKYKVTNGDKLIGYASGLRGLHCLTGVTGDDKTTKVLNNIAARGLTVERVKMHWGSIPLGATFAAGSGNKKVKKYERYTDNQ